MLRRVVGVLLCLGLTAAGIVRAQDVRGSISGLVRDTSGGVMIGVNVTIQNVATGVSIKTTTNKSGLYQVLFLVPGRYVVSAEAPGFRKRNSQELELLVENRLTQDMTLDPAVGEEVSVVAEQAILETSTPTSGEVIDSKTIEEMPLADGTAYFLARLAPGVEFTGDRGFTRPMDNVNLAGVSASGLVRETASGENNSVSSTEFSFDGASNMISQNRMGFSPPAGAVQEFKVTTALYDAQYGQGGGGSVSLALKSGTNTLKGEVSYYNRDESRSGNTFFANRLLQPKEARDYHRANITLHGPITRNRTFFMVSGEYLFDNAPEPIVGTVPTELMRQGNFSETVVRMYDPATTRRVPATTGTGTTIVRDPFPGNIIPQDRFHPISQNVMQYMPLPNVPREQWRADLTNNYYSDRNRPYDYRGGIARIDHVVNESNRLFVNFFKNWREEDRGNWSEMEMSQLFDYRANNGGVLGWTSTLSPTMILDVRANVQKFDEWRVPATELRAGDLGFSPSVVSLTRDYENMPRFDFSTFNDLGRNGSNRPFLAMGIQPILTKISGKHSFKGGYEGRVIREQFEDYGDRAGSYVFNNGPTGAGSTNPGSGSFRDWSAFLVGVPSSGDFDTSTDRINRTWYHGLFIQDDWRISAKTTINMGLRWEMEGPMTELRGRNTRGFDFVTANPIEAPAKARFATDFAANRAAFETAPGSGKYVVTPDTFSATGGYLFSDEQHKDLWTAPKLNFLPRLGVAHQIFSDMVVRVGFGMYMLPYRLSGIDQRGYSRTTSVQATHTTGERSSFPRLPSDPDGGVYGNPLPNGLLEPVGSSLGLLTNVGQDTGTIVPYERDHHQRRIVVQAGIQYKLPWNTLFETNYVASRGYNLIVGRSLNYIPAEFLIDSITRDPARETFFTNDVPNPFRGIEAVRGDDHFNDLIDREKLMRQYPHFENLTKQEHTGSSTYDALQLRIVKRSKTLTLSANYTYSRLLQKLTRLNPSDADLTERVSPGERPHSYKLVAVVELPFGKGRKWLTDAPGWLDAIAGGWRVSANYLWQSGSPLSFGNWYYDPTRNPNDLKSMTGHDAQGRRYGIDIPAWDTSGFYFGEVVDNKASAAQLADDRIRINSSRYKRSFPQTIDGVRTPPYHNLDIGLGKTFDLRRAKLQVRIEAINAENYAEFNAPSTDPTSGSFGISTGQRTLPRDVQVGLRLTF
jgi:hypothetical protein